MLLAGTLSQWAAQAFIGIPKGAALVSPSQKPEPKIETGIPEKVTQTSAQCGLSMVNKYLQRVRHSTENENHTGAQALALPLSSHSLVDEENGQTLSTGHYGLGQANLGKAAW